jgi:hypothetical protein
VGIRKIIIRVDLGLDVSDGGPQAIRIGDKRIREVKSNK